MEMWLIHLFDVKIGKSDVPIDMTLLITVSFFYMCCTICGKLFWCSREVQIRLNILDSILGLGHVDVMFVAF